MSADQLTIIGDSSAQPPTPKHTPTSPTSLFPSPPFETPRVGFGNGANASVTPGPDWTPRFFEELTVFNSTSGNLRDSQGLFGDFAAPFSPSTPHGVQFDLSATKSHKRPLSISSVAAEITPAHVNHPPANANQPLPPSDPSKRVSPPTGSQVASTFRANAAGRTEPSNKYDAAVATSPEASFSQSPSGGPHRTRSYKKARGCNSRGAVSVPQGQTATPPPSSKKGGRKLAPKVNMDTMQNDKNFGSQQHQPPHPDFLTSPHHAHMATFASNSGNLFGYPMSAPATATSFADARTFWASGDPNMAAMDVDYADENRMFQTSTSVQQHLEFVDWPQTSQAGQAQSYLLSGAGGNPGAMQQQHPSQIENHAQLMIMSSGGGSKQMMHQSLDTASADQHALYGGGFTAPMDDPFGVVGPNGGVNPGLLFSRPSSSSMDVIASAPSSALTSAGSTAFNQTAQYQGASMAHALANGCRSSLEGMPPPVGRKELRRTSSAREIAPRRKAGDRASASSPVKTAPRPSLSRSFSENRAPKLRGHASLPVLAPAPPSSSGAPQPIAPSFSSPGTGLGITRSASFNGGRPTGHSSPIRMHHPRQRQHLQVQQDQPHQRLSSLTSIPEVNTPRSRSSVKFTIDANGRARVETTVETQDEIGLPSTLRRNQSAQTLPGKSRWDSSSDDDSSSTDDEPIVIPSRTTSFALPDPIKPVLSRGPLHLSQGSLSDRSTTSTFGAVSRDAPQHDSESDAETIMNDLPRGAGDAASELEKLRHRRKKRGNLKSGTNNLFGSVPRGSNLGGSFGGQGGSNGLESHGLLNISPTSLTEPSLPTPTSQSHGIRCICNRSEAPPKSDGFIVQCESCELWLHGCCINITKRTLPSVYICAFCAQTPNIRGVRLPPPHVGSSPLAHKSFQSFR